MDLELPELSSVLKTLLSCFPSVLPTRCNIFLDSSTSCDSCCRGCPQTGCCLLPSSEGSSAWEAPPDGRWARRRHCPFGGMAGAPRCASRRAVSVLHAAAFPSRGGSDAPSVPAPSPVWWSQTSAPTPAPWELLGTAPGGRCARRALAGPSQPRRPAFLEAGHGPGAAGPREHSSATERCWDLLLPGVTSPFTRDPSAHRRETSGVWRAAFQKDLQLPVWPQGSAPSPPRTPSSDLAQHSGGPGSGGEGGLRGP